MIVSWNWLKEYVLLDMPVAELERRLMMAGLNHESTEDVDGDFAIDLEVTSNRPDCLGHLGVAREVAVLWERELKLPSAAPNESKTPAAKLTGVAIECPDLCSRYIARVIRGVEVGPSPEWLRRRLATIGIAAINNVVDVTNYVLMECGQPLHAFDLAKLAESRIVVRPGRAGETMEAIDHRTYELDAQMCVIADARRAVAIGGVMGGAETEVTEATTDLLIEAARFSPRSIRATARRLNLHSPSSYRFERGVDPEAVDWASARACQLILDVAGGELAAGSVDVGDPETEREPVVLRFSQLRRILGIDVDPAAVCDILARLGNVEKTTDAKCIEVVPPSWRADLTREIDLVEEVARVHGYEKIPEDVGVPMAASARSDTDRVLDRLRHRLVACGFDEALTVSAVEEDWSEAFSPWTDAPALVCETPVLRRADRLRRSLIPSLLDARRLNESLANPTIELFEVAKVYLPQPKGLPTEEPMVALVTTGGEAGDFYRAKGVVEALVAAVNPAAGVEAEPTSHALREESAACRLTIDGTLLGYLGEVSEWGRKRFDLRGAAVIAELRLEPLFRTARLVPRYQELPSQPAIDRDLNLVVDEAVRWADVAATVRAAGGALLESLDYRDTYRDPERLGTGKKSLLLSIRLRGDDTTLTKQQADDLRDAVVSACASKLGAELRA